MNKPEKSVSEMCEVLYQQSKKNIESDCFHNEDEVIVLLYDTVHKLIRDKDAALKKNAELASKLDWTETKLLGVLTKQLKEKGLDAQDTILKLQTEATAGVVDRKPLDVMGLLSKVFKKEV